MNTRYLALLSASAMVLVSATVAQAATTARPPAAGPSAESGGEIVVTAQKRAESINKVGMSITAITGAGLTARGVNTTSDLNKVVAGLSVVPNGSGITGAPIYTLRGIGFNEKSGSALSAVSFADDDMPLPYVWMTAGPSLDLQRVEVLKGPQGTLYGQNSTGGAINFISNKPTDSFRAGGDISYGSYNRVDVDGFVSGPITDTLKARVALRSITADGWQNSATRPGDHLGIVDSRAGRVIVDWTPTYKLRFELNVNGWMDHSQSQSPQVIGLNPSVGNFFGSPLNTPGVYPFYNAVFNSPVMNTANPSLTDWTPGLEYRNNNQFGQIGLRADWQITPNIALTSITAISYLHIHTFSSASSSPTLAFNYGAGNDTHAYSEEVRLTGLSFDGRLHWIAGMNFARDVIHDSQFSPDPQSSEFYLYGLAFVGTPVSAGSLITNEVRSTQAGFASADFDITPKITLTGGVRYTADQLTMNGCAFDPGDGTLATLVSVFDGASSDVIGAGNCVTLLNETGPMVFPIIPSDFGLVHKSLNENNVAWRFGVNWKPVEGTLLYANVSRGFKGGNFPTLSALIEAQYDPVKQEEVTSYEGGFKTRLFGDVLELNGAIFHSDYINKQLYAFIANPLTSVEETTINVPTSVVDGAEFEATLHPITGLTLQANVSYVKTEITKGPDCKGAATCVFSGYSYPSYPSGPNNAALDLKGQPFNMAPQWQANINADYRWSLTEALEGFVGGSVVYQSSEIPTIGASTGQTISGIGALGVLGTFKTGDQTIPAYTTLDLRGGVESKDGKWRVTVWGRNVTNTLYATNVGRGFDQSFRYTGMPATVGVTLGFKYH